MTDTRASRRAAAAAALPWWLTALPWWRIRRWLYLVAMAAAGVAVFYKLLTPEALLVWAPLLLAVLNTNPPPLPGEGQLTP